MPRSRLESSAGVPYEARLVLSGPRRARSVAAPAALFPLRWGAKRVVIKLHARMMTLALRCCVADSPAGVVPGRMYRAAPTVGIALTWE